MERHISTAQTYRQEGALAFMSGAPIYRCPYEGFKRASLYAVDPGREWRRGWIAAKDGAEASH